MPVSLRLFLLFLLLAGSAGAQTLGTITMVYYDSQNRKLTSPAGASWAVETTFLDSVRAVERVYFAPKKVREQASFSNIRLRQRDGETVVYYDDGRVKRRTQYSAGKLPEESFEYYPSGRLKRHTQFADGKYILRNCFNAAGQAIHCDTLARQTICPPAVESPAQSTYVHFPPKALKLGIEGVVKVEFLVNRFGDITNSRVIESPSPELNGEALAAIRRLKKWHISYVDCEPVEVLYVYPITFQIR
ncbi:energy transducer TonB [Hymenobacter cellulosilyticus]|uniref:TonB family protein n=1 Tax=Hymenobacter cellulosilyticus TaxID=2932248 RepID=A0A8T9PZV9_9BACT|nr:energy transducer TonB [Hymenobacter cellulosilyticus]UOQ71036.1 TonB family protein [Hymenobacter cellulosilyticus]